jgi:hypothetical protein
LFEVGSKRLAIILCCGNSKCTKAFNIASKRNSSLPVSKKTKKITTGQRNEVSDADELHFGEIKKWRLSQVTSFGTGTAKMKPSSAASTTQLVKITATLSPMTTAGGQNDASIPLTISVELSQGKTTFQNPKNCYCSKINVQEPKPLLLAWGFLRPVARGLRLHLQRRDRKTFFQASLI